MTLLTSIKLYLPNNVVRRLPFRDEFLDVAHLRHAIEAIDADSTLSGHVWHLTWIDEDRDRVIIGGSDELQVAYDTFARVFQTDVVRFIIVVPDDERERRAHLNEAFESAFSSLAGQAQEVFGNLGPFGVFVDGLRRCPRTRRCPAQSADDNSEQEGGARRCRRRCQRRTAERDEEQQRRGSAAARAAAAEARRRQQQQQQQYAQSQEQHQQQEQARAAAAAAEKLGTSTPTSGSTATTANATGADAWDFVNLSPTQESAADQIPPRATSKTETEAGLHHGHEEEAYATQLSVLREMGFPQDKSTLLALLHRHHGVMAGVVGELFASSLSE